VHWLLFCRHIARCDHLLLRGHKQPSAADVHRAESLLLAFAVWLRRSYSAATVGTYINSVKSAHFKWVGITAFRDLGVAFSRLALLLKILKRDDPVKRRTKTPFTLSSVRRLWASVTDEWAAGHFDTMRFWSMLTLAFQQLLRLNEISNVQATSLANCHPMMVSHLQFFSITDQLIPHPTSVTSAARVLPQLHHAVLRMPPSKADPFGNNHPLFLPIGRADHAVYSPCWNLWFLIATFPVASDLADSTPLFRQSTGGTPNTLQPVVQVSVEVFWSDFKHFCRNANIQYDQYGTHAFRVGGMNTLQDAGVGCPEMMALGRWASDIWTVYSRRQREHLMAVSERMFY
jgi:hypothetical protein